MAFVNERIPEEDIKKYEIAKLTKRFAKRNFEQGWTVDRERDMFLQYVGNEREDRANHWTFCFYWKGHALSVKVVIDGGGEWRGAQWRHYELEALTIPLFDPLPESLEVHRPEILSDLKEALIAFKDLGELSSSTSHTATFNF